MNQEVRPTKTEINRVSVSRDEILERESTWWKKKEEE